MKKHLLKLLTGLTAVSLSVAQPVSVMACDTGNTVIASNEDNSGTGTSSDQLSGGSTDAGTGDSNSDTSNAGDVSSAADSTETTETQQDNKTAAESANKEADTTRQTEGADADLTAGGTETDLPAEGTETEQDEDEQPEVSDGTQTETAAAGEQINDPEQEVEKEEDTLAGDPEQTEAAGVIADQSLESAKKAVVDGEDATAKAVNTSAADADGTQNNENKTVDLTKSEEHAAEEKKTATDVAETKAKTEETTDKETEETASEAEKNKKTGTNVLYLSDALAENSNIAVLSLDQDFGESFLGTNLVRSIAETEGVVKVTKADETVTFYDSLQAAINDAGNSATIELQGDVNEDVTIEDATDLVINLCGKTITSAKTAIENAASNAAEKVKACINIINSKNVTIKSTTTESGTEEVTSTKGTITGAEGTAIKISQSSVDLIGLLIKNNQGVLGGGVYVNNTDGGQNQNTLMVKDCDFIGNTSRLSNVTNTSTKGYGLGGGIYAVNSNVNVSGGKFSGNEAKGGSSPKIGSEKSTSDAGGGAIYAFNSTTTVERTTFEENKATNSSGDGGAIATTNGSLTIKNSNFKANTATDRGGAIETTGSGIKIVNSVFGGETLADGNSAARGGAIDIGSATGDGNVIEKATVKNNRAWNNTRTNSFSGGGLYILGSTVDVKESIISNNMAQGGQGGGVVVGGGKVSFTGTTIEKNKAAYGGGISEMGGGSVALKTGTKVTGNKANELTSLPGMYEYKGCGGGVLLNGVNASLTVESGAEIVENSAKKAGGGICVYGSKMSATIKSGAKLYNNTAEIAGDDLFAGSNSTIVLPVIGENWTLDSCKDTIDGWYIDAENARWDYHEAKKFVTKFAFAKDGDKIVTDEYKVEFKTDPEDQKLYAHITVKNGKSFALKAAHGDPAAPASTPSNTAAVTTTTAATVAATPAVLGATRTPEVVETTVEEPAVLGAEREPAVLGATRGHGTGDESHMGVWGALSLASLASLAGIGAFFARKKKED